MRNDRQTLIRKNILKQLAEAGDFLVLGNHLKGDVEMTTPQLKATEFFDELDSAESDRLITSVRSDRGLKYKINDNGRAWLSENR